MRIFTVPRTIPITPLPFNCPSIRDQDDSQESEPGHQRPIKREPFFEMLDHITLVVVKTRCASGGDTYVRLKKKVQTSKQQTSYGENSQDTRRVSMRISEA